jgi:tetratricopeptide (TPR) repeat protein
MTVCLGGVARAGDDDAAAEARQHYKAAVGHFAVGEFAKAASEYEEAFKLHQDPALLFDAAQSRRLAGENQKALVLYKNFLQLYPSSKQGPAVREQISKLQEAIAAEEKAKTSPPTSTVEPKTVGEPPRETAPAPPQPAPSPPPTAAAPPQPAPETPPAPEKPSVWKTWWFWTAVGGVVVLAVVIPVAIVESRSTWTNLPDQGPGATASRAGGVPAIVVLRW